MLASHLFSSILIFPVIPAFSKETTETLKYTMPVVSVGANLHLLPPMQLSDMTGIIESVWIEIPGFNSNKVCLVIEYGPPEPGRQQQTRISQGDKRGYNSRKHTNNGWLQLSTKRLG